MIAMPCVHAGPMPRRLRVASGFDSLPQVYVERVHRLLPVRKGDARGELEEAPLAGVAAVDLAHQVRGCGRVKEGAAGGGG